MNLRALTFPGVLIATALLVGGCGSEAGSAPEPGCPATASSSAAPTGQSLRLPTPTGPQRVGTRRIALTDTARQDQLAPTAVKRKIAVQFWYPTTADPGRCRLADYTSPAEAAAYATTLSLPKGSLTGIRTSSLLDAPVAAGKDRPLVLYTHGLFGSLTDNTVAAQELASHGYVVAAYGETYESPAVRFPDGSVAALQKKAGALIDSDVGAVIDIRAKDAAFVLRQFTTTGRSQLPAPIRDAVDTDRVGMFGHSAGGAASLQVARDNPAVRAAVNLDGFAKQRDAARGLQKPYLFVASEGHLPSTESTWPPFVAASGRGTLVELAGAGHLALTDLGNDGWIPAFGLKQAAPPAVFTTNFGDVVPGTAQLLARSVTSYFDDTLRGRGAAAFTRLTAVSSPVVKSRQALG